MLGADADNGARQDAARMTGPGHGTCAVTVRFAPTVVGAVAGGVTLTTNTARGSVRLAIATRGTRS